MDGIDDERRGKNRNLIQEGFIQNRLNGSTPSMVTKWSDMERKIVNKCV